MNSTLNHLVGLIADMQLKDRIKEAMESAELAKAEFARATKSTPGAVTQWLSGETKSIKAEKANLMEIATGYSASWIVTGKGPKMAADKFALNQTAALADTAQAAMNNIAPELQGLIRLVNAIPLSVRRDALFAASQVLIGYLLPASVSATVEQAPAETQANTPG